MYNLKIRYKLCNESIFETYRDFNKGSISLSNKDRILGNLSIPKHNLVQV